jgi:hypothetical protein
MAQVAGNSRAELQHPSPDRLMRNIEPALRQDLLHVAIAEREAEIKPGRMPDDLRWELVASRGNGLHAPTLSRIA